MNSSFVQKIKGEIPEEVKFYGIEPQSGSRPAMFVLRTKDGRRQAFPYPVIKLDYEPGGSTITIRTIDEVIVIKGRNLEDVFEYLAANRIKYIQEDYSGIDTEETKLFIEVIIITTANDDT